MKFVDLFRVYTTDEFATAGDVATLTISDGYGHSFGTIAYSYCLEGWYLEGTDIALRYDEVMSLEVATLCYDVAHRTWEAQVLVDECRENLHGYK